MIIKTIFKSVENWLEKKSIAFMIGLALFFGYITTAQAFTLDCNPSITNGLFIIFYLIALVSTALLFSVFSEKLIKKKTFSKIEVFKKILFQTFLADLSSFLIFVIVGIINQIFIPESIYFIIIFIILPFILRTQFYKKALGLSRKKVSIYVAISMALYLILFLGRNLVLLPVCF